MLDVDTYTGIRPDAHQNSLLQARNRRAMETQGKLVGGFGTASVLDSFEMSLRPAHHKKVATFEIDFCFVSHAMVGGHQSKRPSSLGSPWKQKNGRSRTATWTFSNASAAS